MIEKVWPTGGTAVADEDCALDANGDGTLDDNQTTEYVYAMDLDLDTYADAAGSPVPNATLLRAVSYPDGDSRATVIADLEAETSGDFVETTYLANGVVATRTDQNGSTHTYTYDALSRLTRDGVTTLGSGVDGTVRSITTSYDDLGRALEITSWQNADGTGMVRNDVKYWYDGWSNITRIYQDHDSLVDDDGQNNNDSLYVGFTYADGAVSSVAKYNRLTSVTYPDGRVVYYNYPASGIGEVLNRLDNIASSATPQESDRYAVYTYIGSGTIAAVEHPAVDGGMTLNYDIDNDDTFAGWDRFGRIIDQRWTNGAETTVLDEYTYTYDMAGNRTSKDNELHSAFDEDYTYDSLNRLIDTDRGGTDLQAWTLDQLGNWDSFTDSGSTQTRTQNDANEITDISVGIDPTYDDNGNMISGPIPGNNTVRQHYVYDAWNRLVAVCEDDDQNPGQQGDLIATYEYDGLNQRIVKYVADGDDTFDNYLNGNWQTLEVRKNGSANPIEQYLYDARYIDAVVIRFYNGNTDGDYNDDADNILYPTTDAQFNVTAVVAESSGDVVERYLFTPYGARTVLDADWSTDADGISDKNFNRGHQGLSTDIESNLIDGRNRIYDVYLGWIGRDYLTGYGDGMNLYQSFASNPVTNIDPMGLKSYEMEMIPGYGVLWWEIGDDGVRRIKMRARPTARQEAEAPALTKNITEADVTAAAVSGFETGLETGALATGNAFVDTVASTVTLGAVDNLEAFGTSNDYYYKASYALQRGGFEVLTGVATGGVASWTKGGKIVTTAAKVVNTLDVVQNSLNVGSGVSSMITEGVNFENVTKVAGGVLGLRGNMQAM